MSSNLTALIIDGSLYEMNKRYCPLCGNPIVGKITHDHIIPVCLRQHIARDRSLKIPMCEPCNHVHKSAVDRFLRYLIYPGEAMCFDKMDLLHKRILNTISENDRAELVSSWQKLEDGKYFFNPLHHDGLSKAIKIVARLILAYEHRYCEVFPKENSINNIEFSTVPTIGLDDVNWKHPYRHGDMDCDFFYYVFTQKMSKLCLVFFRNKFFTMDVDRTQIIIKQSLTPQEIHKIDRLMKRQQKRLG